FDEQPDVEVPVVWLKPELVAEVKFAEWTPDGSLRAPVFLRLRDDIPQDEAAVPQIVRVAGEKPRATARPTGDQAHQVLEQLRGSQDDMTLEMGSERLRLTHLN